MKAKFDKIMATFAEDNKRPQKGDHMSASNLMDKEQLIMDYKNKNMQKNVQGLIQKHEEESSSDEKD